MRLPQNLDLGAAGPLWSDMCAARGQPIELDASSVERIGGLCLQVLVAAQAQWRADGIAFAVINPSAAFADGVRLMGAAEFAPAEGVS